MMKNDYNLYSNTHLLRAYIKGELKEYLKLEKHIKNQIESDEFICEILEGIMLEQSIEYEESREIFMKKNRLNFEKRLKEIKAVRLNNKKRRFLVLSYSIISSPFKFLIKQIRYIYNYLFG